MRAPDFHYLRNFSALRAYTAPRQVNIEFTIYLAELAVLWGGLALLAAFTELVDNPFADVAISSSGYHSY